MDDRAAGRQFGSRSGQPGRSGAGGQPQIGGGDRGRRGPATERRRQDVGGVGDQGELGLLVPRHQALQRERVGNQREGLGALPDGDRLRQVRLDRVDAVGRGDRVAYQVGERLHRFRVRVLGVQRVGVEAEERQAGCPCHGEQGEDGQDDPAVAGDGGVDRAERREADLLRLGARAQQCERCGKEDEGAGESDQHAHAGDQAKLRDAAERRGDEGQEAGGGRDRGDQDLDADPLCRASQRLLGVGRTQAHLAEADAELDGEIDRNAHEQHGERD